IVATDLKVYQCPSDGWVKDHYIEPSLTPAEWARGSYGATAGWEDYDHVANGIMKTTTKKGPVKGLTSSPMFSANYGAKLAQVLDGLSNTIMIAELRAGTRSVDPRGVWALGFPSSSIVNAGRQAYNPTPNNTLGDSGSDGDEIETCFKFW